MNPDRLPFLLFGLMGLVVVAVIGITTGSWGWFAVALVVHLVASSFVIWKSMRTTQTGTESDRRSRELDRRARAAVARYDEPRNVETELEALKRQ